MSRRKLTYLFILMGTVLALFSYALTGANIDQEPTKERDLSPIHFEYSNDLFASMVSGDANIIHDDSANLDKFLAKLVEVRSDDDSVVTILHIGDSHVQAGFWTGTIRTLFQKDFGNAGRGLIIPYKLSGGNEPTDYAITTPYAFETNKATSNQSGEKLGFTGTGVTFTQVEAGFKIWSKDPFCKLTMFHHDKAPLISPPDSLTPGTYCTIENTESSTVLHLNDLRDTIEMKGWLSSDYDKMTYYGISLENGQIGLLYHDIGSNGAAFEHFMNQTTITQGSAYTLNPDLIIISLGTNNCYGNNFRVGHLRGVIEKFLEQIQQAYPKSSILMTTPRESCQRRTVKGKRTYVPNPNIEQAAILIKEVASEKAIACWDLYAAAGGANISEKWFLNGLSGRDRIHLTKEGYYLTGEMLYEAFSKLFNERIAGIKTVPEMEAENIENTDTTQTGIE